MDSHRFKVLYLAQIVKIVQIWVKQRHERSFANKGFVCGPYFDFCQKLATLTM